MKVFLDHDEFYPYMFEGDEASEDTVECEVPKLVYEEWKVIEKKFRELNDQLHTIFVDERRKRG